MILNGAELEDVVVNVVQLPRLEFTILVLVKTLEGLDETLDNNGLYLLEELAGLQGFTGDVEGEVLSFTSND